MFEILKKGGDDRHISSAEVLQENFILLLAFSLQIYSIAGKISINLYDCWYVRYKPIPLLVCSL